MDKIIIYTDGACRGNQNTEKNLGAYAYLLMYKDKKKSFAAAIPNTTNNKMELMSAIEALKALKPFAYNLPIILYSDSQYLVSGINDWMPGWIAKGWRGVKNADLWQALLEQVKKFPLLTLGKVPGHADCEGNNYVDMLCNAAMDQYIKEHKE